MLLLMLMQLGPATLALKPNVPFEVEWQHDGRDNPGFRLWCNGAIVKNWPTAEITRSATPVADLFTYAATAPGLPPGTHSCLVSAYNQDDPGLGDAKGTAITVPVIAAPALPAPPLNFKIIITIKSGVP